MDHTLEKQRGRGQKSDKEIDSAKQLSSEIQQTVLKKGLKPMVRTFYNRTAFQLPGDARVRISLDTELTMVREDNYGSKRSGDNWRRLDVGTIAPFTHLPKEDVCQFPYAILEVKLQTQHGTTPPEWVTQLIDSHLVEEVPKFSKFIHGCAVLLENRVSLLPFWLPQMDKDIRKPGPKTITPGPSHEKMKSMDQVNIEVDDGESDADENTPLMGTSAQTSIKQKGKQVSKFQGHNAQIPDKMNGKRIIVPVRVEPKVFFANERTFLSWLHFCIVLGGLALGLLNFGDQVGQIAGVLFTGVAMLFMIYALFLYQWRAEKIRNRGNLI